MKTASEMASWIAKTIENNSPETAAIIIMEEYNCNPYASHTSPMSAEQVEELAERRASEFYDRESDSESVLNENALWQNRRDNFIAGYNAATTPSVKADGWVSVEDELPKVGQKVDLWLVPDDEEKSYRMTWTWEKESTARITINGCKVTHWQPFTPPKQQL